MGPVDPKKGDGMKRISTLAATILFCSQLFAQADSGLPLNSANKPDRPVINPGSLRLNKGEMGRLMSARKDGRVNLPSLDLFTGNENEPLEFQRIELFAPGARVHHVSEAGTTLVTPRERHFFLASNSSTGIGLVLDPRTGRTKGYAIKGGEELDISGDSSGALAFSPVDRSDEGDRECGTVQGDQPAESLAFMNDGIVPSSTAAAAGSALDFQAVVAIDTDTEWLDGFNDDTAEATEWIEDAFVAMNVMYERDVATRLLIGGVFLRTVSDSYSAPNGGSSQQLDEFGEYWRQNMGGIDRDFAALFSGKISSNRFSGRAWINQYCNTGSGNGGKAGSYSINAIGSNWSASGIAKFIGHELGHNMGSPHTHCYPSPIDECFSGEDGCFNGPESCPAGGKGTTMSYCHILSSCGSTTDFHPSVQALLEDRLASNSPSCIAAYENQEPPPDPETPIFGHSFASG